MSRTAVIVSDAEDNRALCRLCMIYHEYYVNIFIPNDTFRICAEEAIHDLLRLKVAVGDGLPSNICHQCAKKLMEFRDFKEMCLKTAEELGKYDLDNVLRSRAKEEFGSSENAQVVKEEVNGEEHRIEGDVPVNALTSVAVDPLAVDTMALKEEAQEPKGTAGDGNCLSDISPHGHIQVTEVFVPVPDQLSMEIASHVEEDWRSAELMVHEEIGEGLGCYENGVPVVSLSSVNVDPLAVNTTALKEEAQEPNVDAGEGNSLGDTGPHNHIQVTKIFVPVPDQLALGFVSHVVEDWRPDELMVNEEIGKGLDCNEKGVPVVSLSSVNVDPLAVDTTAVKEEAQYPNGNAGKGNSLGDKCPYNHIRVTEVFAPVPDQLAMGFVTHVEEHWRPVEWIVNEEIGEGVDCSDNDVPKGSLSTVNVDPLAVDTAVDHCNNIGGKTEEPGKESDKCDADRKRTSQNKELDNPSSNPTHEENLQLKYLKPNSSVVDCFPERRVKQQKKNVKFYAPSNTFSQLNDRERPVRNHKNEQLGHQAENTSSPTEYICNYCNTRYSEIYPLALHIKIHVDGMRSASALPKKEFSPRFSQNLLVKAFKCIECGKTFSRSSELNRNSVVHTGVKRFKCNECGKMFSRQDTLKSHSLTHTNVKRFKCNECGKVFTQRGNLKTHSLTHTDVKRFKCNECGKMFTQSGNLKSHLLVHTGVKQFKCNECGKMFAQRSTLKSHLLVHTGVKQFKCNECGRTFYRKGHLNEHSVVHTGVKRFKCNECGKMFTQSGSLITHSLTHTDVKRFKCNECGKMFTKSSDLKSHSVIHTGVKPFKCNYCGELFKWRTSLRSHLLSHADRNPSK